MAITPKMSALDQASHSSRRLRRTSSAFSSSGTLLSTGIGLLVIGYGSSVVAGAVSNRDEDKNLFIPVVGPWMDLADRDCGSRGCGGNEDLAKAMIVTSGIVQGAGVLLGIGSLIIPETTSTTEEKRRTAATKPTIKVTPVSFGAGAGAGVVGRF